MKLFGGSKAAKKKFRIVLIAALVLAAAAGLAALTLGQGSQEPTVLQTEPATQPQTQPTQTAQPLPQLELPVLLENGRLQVDSVFQYSGLNPDAQGADGRDVAAIQVTNCSAEHLQEAEIFLTVDESTRIRFVIRDLPAGMEAMVFSAENQSMEPGSVGTALESTATFESVSPLLQEQLEYTVDGMTVTVTNRSEEAMNHVTVCCHSMLDGVSYGGLTYCYTIDRLEAGESADVEALDCYLEGTEVVRIRAE